MEFGTVSPQQSTFDVPVNFDGLASLLNKGGEHLGDLVWWTLSSAQVDHATLERLWRQAGLPVSLLPKQPTAQKALKTAVRECQVGKPDLLIRLGKESDAETVFALVREQKDAGGNVHHHQEARVILSRGSTVLASDALHHPEVVNLTNRFTELLQMHTPDDVRNTIVKALHDFAAVALRESGGIYWVPRTFSKPLRHLQRAIEQIGKSRFYLLPVYDSNDAAQTLGEVARGSIEEELAALQQEIEQFKAAPPDRASTLERRLESFNDLRTRAHLYRDVLNVQVVGLDEQLISLAESVTTLLAQRDAA